MHRVPYSWARKKRAKSNPQLCILQPRSPNNSLRKWEGEHEQKSFNFKGLQKTVLNWQSPEVWRETGPEREFRPPTKSTHGGGLRVMTAKMGISARPDFLRETLQKQTGGRS